MKHLLSILSIGLLLVSCDKDFNNIGTDLVGEDHFEVSTYETATIVTENFNLAGIHPVQTDNLPYNVLGYYNDPIYGSTNANILSQVALSEYGKDFGNNPVITKVVFSMPYFSRKTATDASGEGTYELDSVYGNDKIKLSLYKSDYFLNEFDPSTNFEERQKYYSTDDVIFAPHSFGNPSNLIFEKDDLVISNLEVDVSYVDDEGNPATERLSPRIREELTDFSAFNWLIDPANQSGMVSLNEFKNFYRGVYIKAEPATSNMNNGTFLGLDMSQIEFEIFHGELLFNDDGSIKDEDGIPGQDIEEKGSVKMFFFGSRLNTFSNGLNYTEEFDKMYLKGGQGAIVLLDLFNPVSDDDRSSIELNELRGRAENWIINEASIEFYVDENPLLTGTVEPERVFLYDIENKKVLVDYLIDDSGEPIDSKLSHLGRLQRDQSGKGLSYVIKVTEHIKDILKNDAENVKLGLMVTNNVNLLGSSDIENVQRPESLLSSTITSHQGTVLYNENKVGEKKLKLNIHYTELN